MPLQITISTWRATTGFSASSQENPSPRACRRACSNGVRCPTTKSCAELTVGPSIAYQYRSKLAKHGSSLLRWRPVLSPVAGPGGKDGSPLMSLRPSRCKGRYCGLPCHERKLACGACPVEPVCECNQIAAPCPFGQ